MVSITVMKKRKIIAGGAIAIAALLLATNLTVGSYHHFSTAELSQVEPAYCALVLGTSKWQVGGGENLFYKYRLEAAEKLYKAGKVKKIVVSGANRTIYYNEPKEMRADLVKAGVPNEDIISDYAGLRTLDSVIRFKKIFGQNGGIVVSQAFQNSRAIYIARKHGIKLYGYDAKDVPFTYGFKVMFREIFARLVCFIDVNVLHTPPHYLGPKVSVKKEKKEDPLSLLGDNPVAEISEHPDSSPQKKDPADHQNQTTERGDHAKSPEPDTALEKH